MRSPVQARNVLIPTRTAEEIAGLPAELRVYVEAYLENLDVLLESAPLGRISMLWEKNPEPSGGFIAQVEGVRLYIAADNVSGVPIVRRVELPAQPTPK